jgi:hypothetical protein
MLLPVLWLLREESKRACAPRLLACAKRGLRAHAGVEESNIFRLDLSPFVYCACVQEE